MHMQFTQTYKYYKVHYRTARARVCDCDGAKFGAHSGVVFHEKEKKTIIAEKQSSEVVPDFVPARGHQLVRLPLFLSGRELLFRT